jgi:hypothetical protein
MNASRNTKQLRCKGALATAFVICLAASLQATEIVSIGNHTLLPNTPHQTIDVMVTNDRATAVHLESLSFYAQVADGGPLALGHIVGPGITATIITPPEVFSVNNVGVNDSNPGQEFGDQIVTLDTRTATLFITQAGLSTVLLGKITVDTTGFFSGSWPLIMSNTQGGPATITAWGNVSNATNPQDPIASLFIDGSISVPEPSSIVLRLFAVAGLAIAAIRNHHDRHSA